MGRIQAVGFDWNASLNAVSRYLATVDFVTVLPQTVRNTDSLPCKIGTEHHPSSKLGKDQETLALDAPKPTFPLLRCKTVAGWELFFSEIIKGL